MHQLTHLKSLLAIPLLLLSLLVTSGAAAQDSWSLERCIDYAKENNLQVKQAELNTRLSETSLKFSKMAIWPNLNATASGEAGFGRSRDVTNDVLISSNSIGNTFSLSSSMTLYNGSQIRNAIKRDELDVQANELANESVIDDIRLLILDNYINILISKEQLDLVKTQRDLTLAQLENSEKQVEAGSLPEGMLYEIEAQLAQDELNIINAQNDYDLAILGLQLLLDLDPNEEFGISIPAEERIETLLLGNTYDPNGIYDYASDNLPRVASSNMALQVAEKDVDIARGNLLPQVTMTGGVFTNYFWFDKIESEVEIPVPVVVSCPSCTPNSFLATEVETVTETIVNEPNTYGQQFSDNIAEFVRVDVSIPIFNNWQARNLINNAEINYLNRQLDLERELNSLKQDINTAVANYRAARKGYEANLINVEAMEKAFEFAESRFNAGQSNSIDYTSAKNNLTQAELNLILSKFNYIATIKVLDFYQGKPLSF